MTNNVNLYVNADPVTTDVSGTGTASVTCGNLGPDNATGSVSLKVVTPFYLNVPTLPTVSGATVAWLYQNTAPDVQSIFQVTFASGIASGATVTVSFGVTLNSGAPNVLPFGRAIFTTDPGNTADVDSDLSRNYDGIRPIRSKLPNPTAGNANLFFTHVMSLAVLGDGAVDVPIAFYNSAGPPGTANAAHFTFSTPFYTRVPSSGRPSGFTALYENSDPAVPSIYRLAVPAGLGSDGAFAPTTIRIPFEPQSGAPLGALRVMGIIVPTATDTQGDLSASHHVFGLLSVKSGGV